MEKMYAFLCQFSNGTTPCRTHLVNKFSEEHLNYALEMEYIECCGHNSCGDEIYTITDKGKRARDS